MKRILTVSAAALFSVALVSAQPRDDVYIAKNLVADGPAHAVHKDPKLVNPWGVAFAPTGPFWVSDNETGVSTVYDAKGNAFPQYGPVVVTIPTATNGSSPAKPTGIVYNPGPGFEVGPGRPAVFIFSTEDGTLSGWNPLVDQTKAILEADFSANAALYKGLALATTGGNQYLYVPNFHSGQIDVFGSNWAPFTFSVTQFQDPSIPAGFVPFNIQNLDGNLWVTYAMQDEDKRDDVPGPGAGYVNVFKPDGTFVKRFASQGTLNAPWGLAIAPVNFAGFSNALLVGNFGDGRINAYDIQTSEFLGQLKEPSGRPMEIEGLWGLIFGNGNQGAEAGLLYYTAGPDDEEHGVFGEIRPQHP